MTNREITTYNIFDHFLFKDLFDSDSIFKPITEQFTSYPIDVSNTDSGVTIEIAALGLEKKDINISFKGDTLNVSYNKKTEDSSKEFVARKITRKAFNHSWKVPAGFNVSDIKAELDKGILTIEVPYSEVSKERNITIG